jgi:hypothetical protein
MERELLKKERWSHLSQIFIKKMTKRQEKESERTTRSWKDIKKRMKKKMKWFLLLRQRKPDALSWLLIPSSLPLEGSSSIFCLHTLLWTRSCTRRALRS